MRYYIGIDLGGTNIVAGVVNEDYALVAKASCKTACPRPAEEIMDDMARVALEAADKAGISITEVEWIGVGSPGVVDADEGMVIYANNLAFYDVPMREGLENRLGRRVYLGNDANAAAYGEFMAGAAKGSKTAVAVTLGTGVGGGVIIDSKIYTGFNFAGAELGHMVLAVGGRPCTCGRKGCFEAYASATALISFTKEAMQAHPNSALWRLCEQDLDKVTGRTPFQGALEGDGTAQAVLEEYRGWLAQGLICLINVLQPEVICLGGGVSNAEEELLLLPLRELIRDRCFDPEHPPKLVRAALGNDAGVVGAAMLCKTL